MPDLHIAGITFTPVDDDASDPAAPNRSANPVASAGDKPASASSPAASGLAERLANPDRADRARQFMPFAALRGYYDMVRQRERMVEDRRELSDDEAASLSRKLSMVKRGMMVTVTHYDRDAYVKTTGVVTGIDATFRTLTIVRTSIALDDILDVEGDDIEEDGCV